MPPKRNTFALKRAKAKGYKASKNSLSPVKQGMLEKQRHIAKHRKRKRLKRIPGFSRQKHFLLASLLSEAFIQRREHLLLRVSLATKFPAGFPLGVVESQQDDYKVVRILVEKALVWMCDMGYNSFSLDELKDARREALLMWKAIERRLM